MIIYIIGIILVVLIIFLIINKNKKLALKETDTIKEEPTTANIVDESIIAEPEKELEKESEKEFGKGIKNDEAVKAYEYVEEYSDEIYLEEDIEFNKFLLKEFKRINKDSFKNLTNALDANDKVLAHRIVHDLKTNAKHINKATLEEFATYVESLLSENKDVSQVLLESLNIELEKILNDIDE